MKYEFEQFSKWIFLSPHYDDVALTFGGLIQFAKAKNILDHIAINVRLIFSRSNYLAEDEAGNLDLSQKREQLATGTRLVEDTNCLEELFGNKNFEYQLMKKKECIIRGKLFKNGEKFEFPFGTKETFDHNDTKIYNELKYEWITLLKNETAMIFCPSGIKQHIDHVITRDSLLEAYQELKGATNCRLCFGEDQPYAGHADQSDRSIFNEFLKANALVEIDLPYNAEQKANLVMKHYTSQVTASYREGILKRANDLNGAERLYLLK